MIRNAFALPSAILAIATLSCATVPTKPADPRIAEREPRTRALIAEVAKQRGLAELKPLDVSFEDAATFRASLDRAAQDDASDPEVERARWVAFGFASPDVDPREIARKVLDEQVAAFYDSKEKRLHVPLDAPEGMGAQADQAAEVILAHEIEHGLQDQHYPIPDLDKQPDDDTGLALKALYEGDATFVMIEVPLSRRGPVDGAQLLRVARQLHALPISVLESMSGKESPELEKAPKIVRDELLLPYFGGMLLVAELYRLGGFPLVDRLFQHPPESTAQVLHPEKYIAGVRPTLVAPPKLPDGMKELARGRLGELGVRTMLSDCLPEDEAAKDAQGWSGDAYLIAAKPDGAMALLWSTAWDDNVAAARFGEAVERAGAKCFPEVAGAKTRSWSLGAGAQTATAGHVVAVVRGLSKAESERAFQMLFALPAPPRPNAPPLGAVQLAPTDEATEHAPAKPAGGVTDASAGGMPSHPTGTIDHGVWRSAWNGLSAKVPEGFESMAGGELTLRQGGGLSAGQIVAIMAPNSPEIRKTLVAAVVDGLGRALGGNIAVASGAPRDVRIDGTPSVEIPVTAAGTPFDMKITFWPRCEGRVLYVISTTAMDEASSAELARWVSSIKSEDPKAAVCQSPAK